MEINQNARIILCIRTRERDQRTWAPVSATSDLDLSASEVELCASRVPCVVERDLLDAQEVLTVWHGGGDVDEHFSFTYQAKGVSLPQGKEERNSTQEETHPG